MGPHQQATGEYPEPGTSPQGQVLLYPQSHAWKELLSYEQLPSGLASNGPPILGISYFSQELIPYLTIGFPLSNITVLLWMKPISFHLLTQVEASFPELAFPILG